MVEIKYQQEKINPLFIIIPSIFTIIGLFIFCTNVLFKSGSSQNPLATSGISLLFILSGIGVMFATLKNYLKSKKELNELHLYGKKLIGEIIKIEEHVTSVTSGDDTYDTYTYNFIVKYTDPNTNESVIAESIETYQNYELINPECVIRLLDGKVLVEKAYVKKAKPGFAWIIPVVFFLIVTLFMIGRALNLF